MVKDRSDNERKHALFNDALNTFYLWSHGIKGMVKDRSDNERKNVLFNDALNTFYLWSHGIKRYGKGSLR